MIRDNDLMNMLRGDEYEKSRTKRADLGPDGRRETIVRGCWKVHRIAVYSKNMWTIP